jgi:hypothetical protein
MEKTIEISNRKLYIEKSKDNIDKFMYNLDYKRGFALFLLVLERLDENEKKEFTDYYIKKIF